jgi:hypothetical protein
MNVKRSNVVSALHGHELSIEWNENIKQESRWYVGAESQSPDDLEETRPWEKRIRHVMVAELLLLAIDLDHNERDFPFMPYPGTTLKEAIYHLSHEGQLGIHGGTLHWNERTDTFTCTHLQTSEVVVLNWQVVGDLLKANYRLMS